MALMKCGWLWRKSSVLRRWKRSWFDLWMDGNLVFYQDETRRDYEDRIRLKYKCANVKAGSECTGVEPPDGISSHCLVIIYMKNGSTLILCADSEDEALCTSTTLMMITITQFHWTATMRSTSVQDILVIAMEQLQACPTWLCSSSPAACWEGR
ncbi:si:ch211-176g13.7 isoform X3 [Polyodon spathula]|uniref:si:ch211-176g13.7 isoform X3 n=1 Tax=Polyodon spathula TaxID=7913 RepID=UPI001B7E8373|nr:si:ch211-176g13.7 isoform X3 [Polyodon spathula]